MALYQPLPPINNQRVKLTSATPFTPEYVKCNLTRSSDPSQVYSTRVQDRQILLENPPRESRAKKEREAKRAKRVASKVRSDAGVIGQRLAREKGLWKLDKSDAKFDLFVALHQHWMGYMSELLGLTLPPSGPGPHDHRQAMPNTSTMHAKLIKADFHFAMITVRQSKNPCLVGVAGIVYHESENSFKIVTRKNKAKLIPKQGAIFALAVPLYSISPPTEDASSVHGSNTDPVDDIASVTSSIPPTATVLDFPHIEFELYGNQICFRSADRASRKFKHKETIEL